MMLPSISGPAHQHEALMEKKITVAIEKKEL
jgi:hypothetical protein